MKLMIAILAASVGLLAGTIHAQGTTQRDMAEKLLDLMNMQETIANSFAAVKQMLPAQMEHMRQTMGKPDKPGPTLEQTNQLIDMISQDLSWNNLKEPYIALYAETFTADELKGMIAFYESPSGRAFIAKQPELMRRSMVLTQEIMMKIMPKIQKMSQDMKSDSAPSNPEPHK